MSGGAPELKFGPTVGDTDVRRPELQFRRVLAQDRVVTRDVVVTAPVRIADLGGWTDTWFAGHGAVCHLAVGPGVTVAIRVLPVDAGPRLVVDVRDFGETFELPDTGAFAERHALLEAAIAAGQHVPERACHVSLTSGVPPGASLGTSAAVVVAVLAAFDAFAGRPIVASELARRAHGVEVQSLRRQSGVQDQIAAAFGGANFIEMPRYPETVVEALTISEATRTALNARLLVVFLGRGHDSSAVHQEVIRSIEGDGGQRRTLDALRALARQGRDALLSGDLDGYGRALSANCAQQAALHASLVNDVAAGVIEVARAHGAAGWKVNGAGGAGGSMTVMCGARSGARAELAGAIEQQAPGVRVLALTLSRAGVQVASVPPV